MGGKNHQPCRNYLQLSTMMSKSASAAFRELEDANIALEELLLSELDDAIGSKDSIIEHLDNSIEAIRQLQLDIDALRMSMDKHNYVDLPALRTINTDELGANLDSVGATNLEAWKFISNLMKTATFYGVLAHFDQMAKTLGEHTVVLKTKIAGASNEISSGTLNLVLEENQPNNFKLEFARLYATWNVFNAQFLASSLLSTEIWYAFTNRGTLLPQPRLSAVA